MKNPNNLIEVSPFVFFTKDGFLTGRGESKKIYEFICNQSGSFSLEQIKKLAIELHSLFCKDNHTDGCFWYYDIKNEEHNWSSSSHFPYLVMAYNCYHNGISISCIKLLEKIVSLRY